MGTFDEWQAQKDSQYILAVDYLEQLAKQHDSTIEATANYLIHCDSLKEIYEKSDNGKYYPAYEPTGYGYYNNDTPPPRIQFLESAKANTDTTGKILSKDFYRMWDNNYFKKSELPAIEPVAPSEPQNNSKKIIDEIVDQADIVKIIGKHVELEYSRNEFKGCCPFHGEKTPSFRVNPLKGLYYCYGCDESGNALDFLTKYEQLSEQDALLELSRQTGIALLQNNDTFNQTSDQLNETQQSDEILERDPLLIKLDGFNIVEAACLISGDDFIEIGRCYHDTNFDRSYPNFIRAERLINSGLDSRSLSDLSSQSLKYFLKNKGYIIRDFNDALPAKIDAFAQLDISQTSSANTELSQQVEKLQDDLATANATISDLGQQLKQAIADRDNLQSTLDAISQAGEINTSEYTTSALLALRAVVNEYWLNYDPSKPKTAPKQDHIRSWIKDNYPDIPPSFGLWIDRIARHPTAK